MEDKSSIQSLRDFAKSSNRIIEVKELLCPRTGIGTTQKYKRMVCIPNNPERTSFFILFNDPYLNIGQTTLFSGAFIPFPAKTKSGVTFRKRNILDKLNIFSKPNGIGNSYFDSKIVSSGKIDQEMISVLKKSNAQTEIINALQIQSNIEISINKYAIDFVPELTKNSHISILNRYEWDTDTKKIEKYFYHIEKIRNAIYY